MKYYDSVGTLVNIASKIYVPYTYFYKYTLPELNVYYDVFRLNSHNLNQILVFTMIGATDRIRFRSVFLLSFGDVFSGYKPEITVISGGTPTTDGTGYVDLYYCDPKVVALRVKSNSANYGSSVRVAVIGQ